MSKVQQEKIATREECNRRKMQNENIATCEKETRNGAIHKKSTIRKNLQHENITTQKIATWKWCSMKKSATSKNYHSEIRKNCTKIEPYSAQTDNGPSVDGPLYTGSK